MLTFLDLEMHRHLCERLNVVWPLPDDCIYFVLLEHIWGSVLNFHPNIPLDEFGPEMYRKKQVGDPIILLVLNKTKDQHGNWIYVVTSDWIKTHKKMTSPRWLLADVLSNYTRFSRNELCLEVNRLSN